MSIPKGNAIDNGSPLVDHRSGHTSSLVVFARAPIAGRVKSRLASRIGEAAAQALYAAFLEDTCELAARLPVRRVVAVDGGLAHPEIVRLAELHQLRVEPQRGEDLGERLDRAITGELGGGGGRVCVIGSDAPTLPLAYLQDAFAALEQVDVVIGPSTDGGYWLIGARRPIPELLERIEWGTPSVLTATLRRLASTRVRLLPFHYDVDEAADLELLTAHLGLLASSVAPATRRALAALAE